MFSMFYAAGMCVFNMFYTVGMCVFSIFYIVGMCVFSMCYAVGMYVQYVLYCGHVCLQYVLCCRHVCVRYVLYCWLCAFNMFYMSFIFILFSCCVCSFMLGFSIIPCILFYLHWTVMFDLAVCFIYVCTFTAWLLQRCIYIYIHFSFL